MNIDWMHFTPGAALFGGVLIGVAASLLMLSNGRIAGISGILGGLWPLRAGERAWRLAFLGGLLLAPWLYPLWAPLPVPEITASPGVLLLAGVLVGLGTRMGSGCTSGHGVCGLSRFSLRSLVATLTFMGAGFATVAGVRHLWGG